MRTPRVTDIVHYVHPGPGEMADTHRAAIVTAVATEGAEAVVGMVWLTVFLPSGLLFEMAAYDATDYMDGTWHWPEREA